MMRYTTVGLLLCVALGGCDKSGESTSPSNVASVQLNAPTNTIAVGGTITLTAIGLDASGDPIVGASVSWTTSSASVASVTAGVVTGVAGGTATITATIGMKSSQTIIFVMPAVAASCDGVTPLSLGVGVVHTLTPGERSTLCVSGGASGSEYVLVPFKSDTLSTLVGVSVTGSGTTVASGAPTAVASIVSRGGNVRQLSSVTHGAFGAAFEHTLRVSERTQLTPLVNATSRADLLSAMRRAAATRSAILNLAPTPTIGTYFQLNANANDACANRQNHTARIAAVSNSAIIAVDSLAPTGGFTDADYAAFAATFDTLIFALDTTAYGAPADLDNNGRVLIFFTQAVNQLTPRGASGYIGGFFYSRDLFPDSASALNPLLSACPGSNEGEMFYVPVVDPNSLYNGFFTSKSALQVELYGTLAHEFQHLINASRRLYVVQTPNWDEEVWLNEGMSHIAEELLYFRESGFAPKQDLALATVAANQADVTAINDYQVQNLLRLADYLSATGLNSPYAENDSLPTRGSTYQLLRYSMDESPNPNSSYLHALINTPNTGIVNFNAVFGGTFTDIFAAVQQQVLANFFNGSGIAVDPKYSFPSWNYRDVIGNGLNGGVNPLVTKPLVGTQLFTLTGGGSGYARFGVAAGATATINSTSGGGVVPADVLMLLVRTR